MEPEDTKAPESQADGRASRAQVWRWVAVAAVAANATWGYLAQATGFGEGSNADISARYPTLFTPAGYAFSIWSVIYASFLAAAIGMLLPSHRPREVHDELAPRLTFSMLLSAVWVTVFQLDQIDASLVVMVALVALAVTMYKRATRAVDDGTLRLWWQVPFSLYLGWLIVASAANLQVVLVAHGVDAPQSSGVAIAAIGVVTLVALGVAWRWRDAVIPLVVSWAAVAIAVKNRGTTPDVSWAALVAASASTVSALLVGLRRDATRRPPSRSAPARPAGPAAA